MREENGERMGIRRSGKGGGDYIVLIREVKDDEEGLKQKERTV